jgi:hypothetical protein
MDNDLQKFVLWLRGEFILLFREISTAFKKNEKLIASIDDLRSELAKERKIDITHEVKIPEIKLPTITIPKIEMPEWKVPEIKMPDFSKMQMPEIKIPEIKIPPIKIPTINVPKPEVTVNVQEREDKQEIKLLTQILKAVTKDPEAPYSLWNDIGVKTPVPVILVDESANYYKAGSDGGMVVSGGGGGAMRPLSNTVFGSGSATVVTPGTAVQLPDQPCSEVLISAIDTNAAPVSVGGSNVKASATKKGVQLTPLGMPHPIKIDNLNKIFVDAQQAGDGITYSYVA